VRQSLFSDVIGMRFWHRLTPSESPCRPREGGDGPTSGDEDGGHGDGDHGDGGHGDGGDEDCENGGDGGDGKS